jgi:glycosyltransferase involved in cell wall biosynthesis
MSRRVLHLIGSFHEGGSERQALQLARMQNERGPYQVEIACLDASGVLQGEVERMGFRSIPEFPLTSFYNCSAVRQVRRFARLLRERQISVVHTHDFYTNIFGMAGAALARVPARVASRRETTGWRTSAQRYVERRAYGLAHAVVANSKAVRDQLMREGVTDEKVVTIYNGVDLDRVSSRPRMERDEALALFSLPREAECRFVTIVANLHHPVKNHPMFLRAARLISDGAVPEARFIIAGEGQLTEAMRENADGLGLRNRLFFIGRCERIAELLALSDVCVLCSTAEGFSNAIIEYMAAARPVVATDVGGAREAVIDGQTGYLIPSDDHTAMAERIAALLRAPETAQAMGQRGRQIVEERFSCELQLEKTQHLYDRVLAGEAVVSRIRNRRRRVFVPNTSSYPEPRADALESTGRLIRGRADKAPGRLRVLIVAPSLDILGGQAVQAARLLARLNEEPSLEVSFLPVNPRLPGPFRRLQAIRYVRTAVTSLFYWGLLLARVRRYDVIHVFSASYLSFVLAPTPAILVARLYGKKTVLNYRSGEARDHLIRWRRTALPTIRLVDQIAVPSGYLVDVFAEFELAARPIFNFVDNDRFYFRDRRPLCPVFLSNRNLEPHYNVGSLLLAFGIIQRHVAEARLIVAGEGSQRDELEDLSRELGLRNVEFAGRVSPEDMPEFLNRTDIFLNGSEIDNMPGSVIEAFAAGLPVVTTDAGGIPHIVINESNGLMVPCGDYEAIAAQAIRLLEDDELAARIVTGAREACRQYCWESVRSEWLELYHELATERHAGRGIAAQSQGS